MVRKPSRGHVYHPAVQRVPGRESNGMDEKIELAPILLDALEHGLHLAGRVLTSRGMKIGASSSRANGSTYFFALSLR